MQQRREEKEQLFLGQLIAQAHALANAKWHKVFRFMHATVVLRQESFGSERFGFIPMFGIHVDGVE